MDIADMNFVESFYKSACVNIKQKKVLHPWFIESVVTWKNDVFSFTVTLSELWELRIKSIGFEQPEGNVKMTPRRLEKFMHLNTFHWQRAWVGPRTLLLMPLIINRKPFVRIELKDSQASWSITAVRSLTYTTKTGATGREKPTSS